MPGLVNNSLVFAEDWAVQLQRFLDEPNRFKEICDVRYTDTKTLNNPYLTDASVQTGSRGTPYAYQAVSETNETLVISTFKILAQFIDRADLAQSTYSAQMTLAARQAFKLNQSIEAAVYADHANRTDFGSGDITGGSAADTTTITVSATNIDDIVRHVKRVIRVAGGEALADQNGIFFVWRPSDLEMLEGFMQANGFSVADAALRNGLQQGVRFAGCDHYSSNQLTSGHVVAGVKGVYTLGILKSTYGQIVVDEKDPSQTSGVSIVSRVDFGIKAWTSVKPVLFDINVA